MTVFSELLTKSLHDRGWSHGKMAREMADRQQNVSRWASGSLPKWPTVERIATALDEPIDEWAVAWQKSQPTSDRITRRADAREVAAIRKGMDRAAAQLDALAERLARLESPPDRANGRSPGARTGAPS